MSSCNSDALGVGCLQFWLPPHLIKSSTASYKIFYPKEIWKGDLRSLWSDHPKPGAIGLPTSTHPIVIIDHLKNWFILFITISHYVKS